MGDGYSRTDLRPHRRWPFVSGGSAGLRDPERPGMPVRPACAPDPNPIETAFPKPKDHLLRIGARAHDPFLQALGDICGLFDPGAGRNVFGAAGYAPD